MGRVIDPKDLNEQDVRYLQDRPWLTDSFTRQGFVEEMQSVKEGQVVRRSPEEESQISTDHMRVGTQAPQQELPRPNGVLPDDPEDEVDDNYEEWTVDELKAEIDERNKEEREAPLSKDGKKADLAARLHEDDAAAVTA